MSRLPMRIADLVIRIAFLSKRLAVLASAATEPFRGNGWLFNTWIILSVLIGLLVLAAARG